MSFNCLFSYHSLLVLHYGDKLCKSESTREQAREVGLSIRQAEWHLNAKLFLDKYPRWEIDGPHWSVILHNMFLHATEQGWKEAERFIQQGHQQSLPRLDPEADVLAIKLVGYWTSCQEIRDLYHSVYLLGRLPAPLPCWQQWREEAIWDILSSLKDCLHRWGYTAAPEEDAQGSAVAAPLSACQRESWSRGREDLHHEALWEARKAHQQAREADHMLECDIERLSRG